MRRRNGGEGEFSPLPRRRKAWFVPLLCLCLPFLTRYLLARPRWPDKAHACVPCAYAHLTALIRMHVPVCTSVRCSVYLEEAGNAFADFVIRFEK